MEDDMRQLQINKINKIPAMAQRANNFLKAQPLNPKKEFSILGGARGVLLVY
jgi:hypothetical protein